MSLLIWMTADPDNLSQRFYIGTIIKLDRTRGWGVIRSASGRELVFQVPFVTVIGAKPGSKNTGLELLNEGDTVGFDVTRTAKGIRVCTIKPTHKSEEGHSREQT